MKYSGMFWNWLRWQCLNLEDFNNGEISKGSTIDGDQYIFEIMKMAITSNRKLKIEVES